jgi:maltoporin
MGLTTLKTDGQPTMRLAKLTIAPTLTMGQGFWSRPELRAFVTYGKWNGSATGAVNAANEAGAVFTSTSGTSYGVQLETWF